MTQFIISNVNIFTPDCMVENGFVKILNGKIVDLGCSASFSGYSVIDGKGLNLIPGFIDVHIHGANGADVMDGVEESLNMISTALPNEGTTSFLATTITQSNENLEKALKVCSSYKSKKGHSELLGVHLEGPFIEPKKAGAQPVEYIREPELDTFNHWQEIAGGLIKVVTMAPERDQNGKLTSSLSNQGVVVSAGHTELNFQGAKKAVKHGVSQVTHLCNAMNGIHHRDIGLVGAAFMLDSLVAELIVDGVHVSEEMVQLIYQNIGSNRLILVTDSMRAKYLPPGDYDLGGQRVHVTSEKATLENGSLAGSILKMVDGCRFMLRKVPDVKLSNIIQMASVNPAKQIGVFDRKGSIEVGKDADLLLVDDEINIRSTWCKGELAYEG